MNVRFAGGLGVGALVLAAGLALAGPPESRKEPVKETVQGVEIVDQYRWLEGDNSDPAKMGQVTPEVGKWTDEQNAYTRKILDNLPGRKELEAKLRPLMEVGSVSTPRMRGERYFYSKREGSQNQAVVYMRQGYKGEPTVLLDPAKIDPSGLTTVSWYEPTEDGKLLAYGTYRSGDENSVLHLMEVDGGKKLPLEISGKVSGCDWLPDKSGFVYRNLSNVNDPYSGQVMFHRMGKEGEAAKDATIIHQYTKEQNEKLATTYGPDGGLDKAGKWIVISYATGTRNNDLWVAPAEEFLKTGKVNRREITVGKEAQSGGTIVGDTMFMLTTMEAPNGRLVAVDLNNPQQSDWKVLVPERKDAVIQGVSVAKGVLAVDYLKNASSSIE